MTTPTRKSIHYPCPYGNDNCPKCTKKERKQFNMTLPEQYAHDYRDMAMNEEELRKMLEEFEEEIRKERVTHCDDINCPECSKVAYEAGVKAESERVLSVLESEGYLNGRELLPHNDAVKGHGTCCYCGKCGHFNDECVCEHNELLQALTTQSEDNK